jgi:trigger factor
VREEIVNVNDTRLNFVCTFDAGEIEEIRGAAIKKFCKEASVSGFRKGKVPESVVLTKFSGAIDNQVRSDIIDHAIETLTKKQSGWEIFALVGVDHGSVGEETTCTLTVDVIPEFSLPDYKNISITPINVAVEEHEVVDEMKNLLRRQAKYLVVDRDAQKGDFVRLNYVGKFDDGNDVASNEKIPMIYGTCSNTWEEAGAVDVPGVRAVVDGVIGMGAGDKKIVFQTFEDGFEVPELAGKTVNYSLEVIEVRECVMPELNDDLLQSFSVKTEDELRERVRASILSSKTSKAKFAKREELLDFLCEASDVKVPDSVIAREASNLVDMMMANRAGGLSADKIMEYRRILMDNATATAVKLAKISVILAKIAKCEKLEIAAGDIENIIWQDIHARQIDANRYVSELKKDSKKVTDVRRRALQEKTIEYLLN